MTVKVVTDSTSDLPPDLAADLGITVVPVYVHFGTETFKDGVEITADEFYERLVSESRLPTTSAPSIGEFIEVYDRLGKGADSVLSVHISDKLSGTYNAAVQAKEQAKTGSAVEVIDSRQASMGLGMMAMTAARAANLGADLEEVAGVVRRAVGLSQCLALLDTLEFLQRGGRIGKARAMLGAVLKIKPMIIVRDGEVHELGKARTFRKGLRKFQDAAKTFAPLDSLSVLHATSPQVAEEIASDLGGLLAADKQPFIARFGPALGTHLGPGAVGVGLLQSGGAAPSNP